MSSNLYLRKVRDAVTGALAEINEFLTPFGLSARCRPSAERTGSPVGVYESGSVFEKDITFRLFPRNIIDAFEDDAEDTLPDILEETRITVFHEVGHGLMEQLLDWGESFRDALAEIMDGKYFDIFYDDNVTEEDIVEDFARAFNKGLNSPLQEAVEEVSSILENA